MIGGYLVSITFEILLPWLYQAYSAAPPYIKSWRQDGRYIFRFSFLCICFIYRLGLLSSMPTDTVHEASYIRLTLHITFTREVTFEVPAHALYQISRHFSSLFAFRIYIIFCVPLSARHFHFLVFITCLYIRFEQRHFADGRHSLAAEKCLRAALAMLYRPSQPAYRYR